MVMPLVAAINARNLVSTAIPQARRNSLPSMLMLEGAAVFASSLLITRNSATFCVSKLCAGKTPTADRLCRKFAHSFGNRRGRQYDNPRAQWHSLKITDVVNLRECGKRAEAAKKPGGHLLRTAPAPSCR